jgi:putative ABC transport system permease protein
MADAALGVGGLPFWWQDGLTPETIWWVGILAVVSTLLCGALPAILLTNQREWGTLQRAGSSNWSPQAGMGLKAVVAAQFALSVGLLTMAVAEWPDMVKNEGSIDGLSSDTYLTAVVHVRDGEPEVAPGRESAEDVALVHQALLERLRVDPGVAGATIATALPGMLHPQVRTQTDKVGDTPDDHPIRYSAVEPAFFDVMGIRVRAGRGFSEQDFSSNGPRSVVVVNESYARERLGGTAVIGRRIRFARRTREGGDWREVVGVVQDFAMNSIDPSRPAGVYIPLVDTPRSVSLAVRTPDLPAQFAPRLRSLGAGLGPLVAIQRVQPLDQVIRSNRAQRRMEYVAVAVGAIAVILLTMGGLSAVTSFFVSRRTHEMGIRTALGAQPARVALDIYSGAVRRLGWGVIAGVPTGIALGSVVLEGGSVMVSLKVSVALIAVGLLACVPATRRLLAVDPVDAIRGEA